MLTPLHAMLWQGSERSCTTVFVSTMSDGNVEPVRVARSHRMPRTAGLGSGAESVVQVALTHAAAYCRRCTTPIMLRRLHSKASVR